MDDKNLTFKFTEDGADLMIGALGKLPFETVAPLVTDLNNQHQEQIRKLKIENKDKN